MNKETFKILIDADRKWHKSLSRMLANYEWVLRDKQGNRIEEDCWLLYFPAGNPELNEYELTLDEKL
jgi:hypothetical protein